MNIKILSLSATSDSVSRTALPLLTDQLRAAGHGVSVTDIRTLPPIWMNSGGLDGLPASYRMLYDAVGAADAVIFLLPVYCYTMSSGAKAVTEVVSGALEHKPVAFVTAAGTHRSHLAIGNLMASLAFEQETFCFPRQVLLTADDLDANGEPVATIRKRLRTLVADFCRFAELLRRFRAEAEADAA